jgi:DNA-directed RNA polymerase I, II, and III subunit RPABC1
MIVEDDMQMSLEEFARRYGREDGEPEYVWLHFYPIPC